MSQSIKFDEESGLYWPTFEGRVKAHHDYHTRHLKDLDYAVANAKKGTVVQAGGNVGIWPLHLVHHFIHVLTFEPDPDLYACLELNILRYGFQGSITARNEALGADFGTVNFKRTGASGTGFVSKEKEEIGFEVNCIPLDSIKFSNLTAMFIDIEGYEVEFLMGARKTIEKHKPLIQIELLKRCEQEIDQFLVNTLNYKLIKRFGKDGVYQPNL